MVLDMDILSQRVAYRFAAASEANPLQQTALKELQRVEKFLDAYEKAFGKYDSVVKGARSSEPKYLLGAPLQKFWAPFHKFSPVARNLAQDNLDDLYYETEDSLNDRARRTFEFLKLKLLEIFNDGPPSLATPLRGSKGADDGGRLYLVESVDKWAKANRKWIAEVRKGVQDARKETKKSRNWKKKN